MYLDHFGLREHPFRITPHTEFFFAGASRGATLDALIYAITHDEGIVKVSGEVGSGKTMLCRMLLERLPENVVTVYLATPSLTRDDVLYALAGELNLAIPPAARSAQIVHLLQDHLIQLYAKGHQVVVLIDEAHAMPPEALEEIRLLSNLETKQHKLLQLVMFGQPELNTMLARHDMRQLKERITHNFTLGPLAHVETGEYLDFRLRAAGYKGATVFSPQAVNLIAGAAQGLTRRINIIADKALLAAYASGAHEVGSKEARAAVKDCDFSVIQPSMGKRNILLAAGGVFGLFTIIAWGWLSPESRTSAITGPQAAAPSDEEAPAMRLDLPIQAAQPDTATSSLTEQRLAAGQSWLASADDEHWFIQLRAMNADQSEQIEGFLQKLEKQLPPEQTRAYLGKRDNTPRIGIIFGEYASYADAQSALAQLPPELRNGQPYLRQVRKLR